MQGEGNDEYEQAHWMNAQYNQQNQRQGGAYSNT